MSVSRRGAGQQSADRLNGLAIASNDAPDISLTHREAKHGHVTAWAFRDDDFVGELHEMADDELEKLFHVRKGNEGTMTVSDGSQTSV